MYLEIWRFDFYIFFSIHFLFLLILGLVHHKKIRTFLTFGYFFFVGISSVFINDDANYSNYFDRFSNNDSRVVLKVDKVLKPSSFHQKYQVKVIEVDHQKTRGLALLNIAKDSFQKTLKVDELILVNSTFSEINSPLNPHQFDYQKYLKNQGIRQQIFIGKSDFLRLGFGSRTLKGWAEQFRNFVQFSLNTHDFKVDEIVVMNALLLGERKEISKELLTDYSNAGAIHILAVSGLHVGIILILLVKIFSFLTYFKNGKIVQTILILIILWMFAFIAGLSASVVRAVTMFSFLAIGQQFGSKRINLFSLFSSLFILLIFNPLFLFDFGFQLSYLAVLGIITMQQKVYHFFRFKSKIIDFFWQISSVSIAAQIGVLPLSLYYFHQFPGLFFLSNMVIIPVLGFVLMMGIVVSFLSICKILPPFLADLYGFIISLMNGFVNWISNQEAFLWKDISLSFWLLLASYVLIFFGVRFLQNTSTKKMLLFLGSIVVLQSVILFEKFEKHQTKEFIVFHKTKQAVIGFRNSNTIEIHHNVDSLQQLNSVINPYKIGENVEVSFKKMISNVYMFENQPILIIDSLGVYQLENLKNSVVILQNSPKINLERMITAIQPKIIIADGSNFKSYINRWKITSQKMKIPFYYTGEKGAFRMKN
ncbi:ComEC/Rec2 family competence protein [Polaribacter gangjinensis]|uniref:ComEC/Rec2 family competence protein n=1 Tax=Polaribacter gangjinensis TaxID=574710 RepID=UPI001CFF5BD2|nr:ComEC/Rec2 family competence protein [Polaribacter gangjinensis]